MLIQNKDFIINLISSFGAIFYFPLKWIKRRSFNLVRINKILIIAYNHGIGTYMLLTPMIRSLKVGLPNSQIFLLLSSEVVREIAQKNGYIDEIIFDEELPSLRLSEGLRFFKQKIAPKKFDLAISTIYEASSKNAFLGFFSGASYRIGFNRRSNAFLDTFSFGWKDGDHEVERYLNLLRFLGINNLDDQLSLSLSEDDEMFAEKILQSCGVSEDDLLLGIHPGAKKEWFQKIWPLERFVRVAKQFSIRFGAKVIFFGGPDEDEIFSRLKRLNSEFILANHQRITQTAALIKRCNLFLSNDSGIMHLAAAAKVPTVAIFGPTLESKNGPWKVPHTIIRKKLPCSPCYRYQKIDCKNARCLKLVSEEEVFNALLRLHSQNISSCIGIHR